MEQLQATKVIRKIMRKYGKSFIWTNKYASGTRTVKCWARLEWGFGNAAEGAKKDAAMIAEITKTLAREGAKFEVRGKVGPSACGRPSSDSIIIALF